MSTSPIIRICPTQKTFMHVNSSSFLVKHSNFLLTYSHPLSLKERKSAIHNADCYKKKPLSSMSLIEPLRLCQNEWSCPTYNWTNEVIWLNKEYSKWNTPLKTQDVMYFVLFVPRETHIHLTKMCASLVCSETPEDPDCLLSYWTEPTLQLGTGPCNLHGLRTQPTFLRTSS